MKCGSFANYRIDVVNDTGQDYAFTCKDHLAEVLISKLKDARGHAARVSTLSASSDEPCELGVE